MQYYSFNELQLLLESNSHLKAEADEIIMSYENGWISIFDMADGIRRISTDDAERRAVEFYVNIQFGYYSDDIQDKDEQCF